MQQFPLDARGARRFLTDYWQKKFWLARDVLPQISTAVDRARLIALACRDDVESRLVTGAGKNWRVEHGPFRRRDFLRLPPRNWTLLVNGVENFVPAARELQQRFGFVPYARQDDVMNQSKAPIPTRPALRVLPNEAIPTETDAKTSGITTMRRSRRKICPAGSARLTISQSS